MSNSSCDACGADVDEYRLCSSCDGSAAALERIRAEEREALVSKVEAFFETANTPELRANVSILLTELRGRSAQPKCATCGGTHEVVDSRPYRGGQTVQAAPKKPCPDCAPKDDARAKALEALRAVLHWYDVDSSEFNREHAIALCRRALERTR